ncbi:hypothetical protein K439DRAFT_1369508 [Ramaria rubella]|nr:hypothetical protein K439DRAFT_1369508 [Ramaria rubella]
MSTPQPLPVNPYAAGSQTHQAYKICLALQENAANSPTPCQWKSGPSSLICSRLLGYMIIYAPTEAGRMNITKELNSCIKGAAQLYQLAKFFIDRYLRVFKENKGRAPAAASHFSRPSFDAMQERLKLLLECPPKNHSDAKAAALIRDDYHCMVTGVCDMASFKANDRVKEMARAKKLKIRPTQCAHIFASYTSQNISGENQDGPKLNYAASAWAAMERIGSVLLPDELNDAAVHRLENILTLEGGVHEMFDSLYLWFEATVSLNVPNSYHVCSTNPELIEDISSPVIFTSMHPSLPLPDPRYLALHAACAKVAHLSGAGEYVESVYRDMDSAEVLANNGSSADVLETALARKTRTLVS